MNKISGQISQIETHGNLSLVSITTENDIKLQAIVIDTPQTAKYLVQGQPVKALFKETEVMVSTGPGADISVSNSIPCKVVYLEAGKLLSRLELSSSSGIITGIIATSSLEKLHIKPGQDVWALIKLNEIMLSAE